MQNTSIHIGIVNNPLRKEKVFLSTRSRQKDLQVFE